MGRRLAPLLCALVLLAAAPPVDGGPAPAACDPRSRGFLPSFCVSLPGDLGRTLLGDLGEGGVAVLVSHGVPAERVDTARGFLVVEKRIGEPDRALLALTLTDDIAQLELDFGQRFTSVPKVYVFATSVTFATGLQVLFLYSGSDAERLTAHGGVLDPTTLGTAVNWGRVAGERPVTIVRHELTHAIVRQILGAGREIPIWFDEGLAMLEQSTIAGTEQQTASAEYLAAAMLSAQRVSLAQLATLDAWLRQTEAQGMGTYAVAGAALRTLRERVGSSGLVSLLGQVGRGVPFTVAFERAAAIPMEDFTHGLPEALAARTSFVIVIDARTRADGSIVWSIRGAPPLAEVAVSFKGVSSDTSGYRVDFVVGADEAGMFAGAFGATAPLGAYVLTASVGQTTYETTFDTRHD